MKKSTLNTRKYDNFFIKEYHNKPRARNPNKTKANRGV